ncbi:hypothetical protein Back2_03800 [Nocardioides baekrokdamisoli]|uniref:Uncharacterized protein n=1 Tax=Nocardioides baekrokdamisoli TaxID=1804624 RepID=A0A3G9IV21_9ACTN|nr:hypothetical protein Back2_03800 [Nocardioides baekrokdamisoli]
MVASDLVYDPNEVGSDLIVETWISQGPRCDDPTFDPQLLDVVSVVDADGESLAGRVVRRDGNRVWVQFDLVDTLSRPA